MAKVRINTESISLASGSKKPPPPPPPPKKPRRVTEGVDPSKIQKKGK